MTNRTAEGPAPIQAAPDLLYYTQFHGLTGNTFAEDVREYRECQDSVRALQAKKDGLSEKIAMRMEMAGAKAVGVDTFRVSMTTRVNERLDRRKLLEAGVTVAQMELGTVESSSTYPTITDREVQKRAGSRKGEASEERAAG